MSPSKSYFQMNESVVLTVVLCFQGRNFTLSVALSRDEPSWNSHEMLRVMSNGLAFIQDACILVLKNLR